MPAKFLLASVTRSLPEADRKRLKRVAAFSVRYLSSIQRRGGGTYAEHCIRVAATLREANDDLALLSVALLHDLPVHPEGARLLRVAPLTAEERRLIKRMHTLRRLHIDANTKDLDHVIEAVLKEPKLLPLRMAHRLSDVRLLSGFSPALRKQIAHESLHMYSAIAGRLGMHRWRSEMEDLCFPIIQPKIASSLQKKFNTLRKLDDTCLEHTERFLRSSLRKAGINCTTEVRRKGLYSTYRKMAIKRRAFEDLTDRLAVRFILPTLDDCYRALGVVHGVMHPMPGKLKDYIGAPKENGYRLIHTVVYPLPGVTEQPMEIQIRTLDMNGDCEYGSAAHGKYKESIYALQAQPARVNLFRNLESLRSEARSPAQFEDALRKYFHEDHIAIFDSRNNLYHLRKPASVLDFVCHAFPKRVAHLQRVRLNGRIRSIDTRLQDGDTVEAHFAKTAKISREWAHACCHPASAKWVRACLEEA